MGRYEMQQNECHLVPSGQVIFAKRPFHFLLIVVPTTVNAHKIRQGIVVALLQAVRVFGKPEWSSGFISAVLFFGKSVFILPK